jgi:D-glycero-alpha-D-manno-heptose 1-phosphate guanylyltransferase
MEAIILAGGQGTRLRSVVPDLPKPMAPIHEAPFLKYQLDYWIKQGVHRFILSVGYKREKIQGFFGTKYDGVEIVYAVEEKPLGTGGGMLHATKDLKFSGPFLVINGDTLFEVELAKLLSFHREKKAEITMALLEVPLNSRYGRVQLGKENQIEAFQPISLDKKGGLVNGGIYLIERQVVDEMEIENHSLSLEDQVFPKLLKNGRQFYGFISASFFIDIGVPEDYSVATLLLRKKNTLDSPEKEGK